MRFLVIEGLDGSGKSTQVSMLGDYLESCSIKYKFLHFPRLETGLYGNLVARYLRGEMGAIDEVDPYLVALIFAGDRMDAKPLLQQWIDEDYLVVVDRYVYSNIAFQAAKVVEKEEQINLADWIFDLEYSYNKIPAPDLNIYFDVPFKFTKERLSETREGIDREYLKGKNDIHEADIVFQDRVRKVYHDICAAKGNLSIINCANEEGEMKSPSEIFQLLKNEIGI